MPDAIDRLVDVAAVLPREADRAPAERVLRENLCDERERRLAESRVGAGFHLLPGMHQRVPALGIQPLEQQALDLAATRITMAEQARRDDARIVDDKQIARREEGWQIADDVVSPRASVPVHYEQPRRAARGGRLLRDQVLGQFEIELTQVHETKGTSG